MPTPFHLSIQPGAKNFQRQLLVEISEKQQNSPNSRLWLQTVPGGLLPGSSPPSRPWSSQLWIQAAGQALLPTLVCWGSEWWCAAPPRCSKDGWSSSGFGPHPSPAIKQSERVDFFDWFTQLSKFQKAFLKHKMAFYGALCSEAAHW